MNLMTLDDISKMLQLSRNYTRNVIVKSSDFPQPVIGIRKPRWDAAAITKHLKCTQKANKA